MNRREFLATTAGMTGAALFPSLAFAAGKSEISHLILEFGLDPVFAPHFVAMQKGWFRDAGFTSVSIKTFAGGALAGQALIAGDIQLWTPGNLPPISMANTGIPIAVLGTNCLAAGAEGLVARKDANIKAPEDLYKVRIGLLAGSTASADMHYLAKHYQLEESRLKIVNMPPPAQLAALKSGDVQAMFCWQPWYYKALHLGDTVLVHSGTTSGFAANQGAMVKISSTRSVFVASQAFARKNPNAIFALVKVLVRGQRYVADPRNRNEVVKLVAEKTRQDLSLVQAIWDQYVFDPAFDQAYADDMRRLSRYLVDSGRVTKAKDPLDYTYSDPAKAAGVSVTVPGRWHA